MCYGANVEADPNNFVFFYPKGQNDKPNHRRTTAFGTVACALSGTVQKRSNAASAMYGRARLPGNLWAFVLAHLQCNDPALLCDLYDFDCLLVDSLIGIHRNRSLLKCHLLECGWR